MAEETLLEMIGRRYSVGTFVVNCMTHGHLQLIDRPQSCGLCHTDLKNAWARALATNNFLNDQINDIRKLVGV